MSVATEPRYTVERSTDLQTGRPSHVVWDRVARCEVSGARRGLFVSSHYATAEDAQAAADALNATRP